MESVDPSIRCPRLGSEVPFYYCRKCGENGLPCFKVFDCWWEIFDVVAYLRDELSPVDFERLKGTKPKEKVLSLLEIIEQAKKNASEPPAQ